MIRTRNHAGHVLLSLLSSALTILSFPKFDHAGLAWVALAPVIAVTCWVSPRAAFFYGWLSGVVAYCGILYWFVPTFQAAQQPLSLACLSILGLALYLGLFWAFWATFISRVRHGIAATRPLYFALVSAAAWAALEFLRTFLFSGFPWTLLGDTQVHFTALIQTAAVTGVYGLSFVLVFTASALGVLTARLGHRPHPGTSGNGLAYYFSCVVISAALAVLLDTSGYHRIERVDRGGANAESIKVALLQGNIDQYKKWNRQYVQEIEETYGLLVRQATDQHPDLIVWPETSVPGYLLQDPPLRYWLTSVVRQSGTYHLAGAPVLHGRGSYNSAFLLAPDGRLLGEYAKQHLVPFGETVPFGAVLGRWIRVLNELGGFAAGKSASLLQGGPHSLGVNICYEAIFPALVRKSVLQGATLIANITNDGWYMRTAAPYQHFAPNVLRAVENERWLVRADNTGVTAIIDPAGRIFASTPIFVTTLLTGTVQPRTELTFYTRFGDLFAWACLLLTAFAYFHGRRRAHLNRTLDLPVERVERSAILPS